MSTELEISKTFEDKAAKEFSKHGKEEMTALHMHGTIYGFGSELACLRCFHKYRQSPDIKFGFSENLDAWFFSYTAKYN